EIKVTVKIFIMLQVFLNKCCAFELCIHQRFLKCIHLCQMLCIHKSFHYASIFSCTDSPFERIKYYYFSSEKLSQLVTIIGKDDQYNLASIKLKEAHWIGLHDLYTEGHWMWVDRMEKDVKQFWHKRTAGLSEPDNWTQEDSDGEDCACLETESEWFDASCSKLKKFIWEK
uniref:C-type lectin domain-containing protein n=1 Tax=Cyprinus carpio TaxID=7962 RepID=A0A8C1P468_CYPCA